MSCIMVVSTVNVDAELLTVCESKWCGFDTAVILLMHENIDLHQRLDLLQVAGFSHDELTR